MTKLKMHFQKKDYRHYICIGITLISLAFGYLFPNSLPRLAESLRDFVTSLLYWAKAFFSLDYTVRPTIVDMPKWEFAPSPFEPVKFFPYTWEEFKVLWGKYCSALITKENILAYLDKLSDIVVFLAKNSVFVLPTIFCVTILLNSICSKVVYKQKKSKPLQKGEKFTFKYIYPIKAWVKDFVAFCKENDRYYKGWIAIWLLHFNVYSIVISAMAFYFFFCANWEALRIYDQLLKLQLDLSPVIRFIPVFLWVFIFIIVYNIICLRKGMDNLYKDEQKNEAFVRQREIVSVVSGASGKNKTQMVEGMAQTSERIQFKDAYSIMKNKEIMFPNFPWQNLRKELKRRIDARELVDYRTCKRFANCCGKFFEYIIENYTYEEWQERRKKLKFLRIDYTFGYDFEHYSVDYNDNMKITKLFEAIEPYAQAYMVFIIETTLITANISIRADTKLVHGHNMPYRDMDFFHRNPREMAEYSQYAHIIDNDTFRLGTKMIKDNEKARGFILGTYVWTEIDKERKNMKELKETKIKDEECNQRNDLFNACFMTKRHGAIIDYIPFVRTFGDLQRAENWGVDGRGLGEVIEIVDKDELAPVLPPLSFYWICKPLFLLAYKLWDSCYDRFIKNRSDNTLFVHCMLNIMAKIHNHYDKIEGLYGRQTLNVEIKAGSLEGEPKKDKWRILTKKDRSRRYRTDGLKAIYEPYKPNTMHIDDFIQYAGELGTQEENELQNSFFQNDIKKMRLINSGEAEKK